MKTQENQGLCRPTAKQAKTFATLDFGRDTVEFSPINMASVVNTARAMIACRMFALGDDLTLGAMCAGERTYGGKHLIDRDRFTFQPIFGDTGWRFVRQPAFRRKVADGSYARLDVRYHETLTRIATLSNAGCVFDAVTRGRSIVAVVRGHTWTLHAPVTTIHVQPDRWQIDIGPVLIPDRRGGVGLLDVAIGWLLASSDQPHRIDCMAERIGFARRSVRDIYQHEGTVSLYEVTD